MKDYILSIDAGTTSCRAILVDESADYEVIGQTELRQIYPQPGWVEHDPIEIRDIVKQLIAKAADTDKHIKSIGITNQRETVVVWDKESGMPLYNAIVWQDKRTAPYALELREGEMGNYIKERTGLIPDAYFSGTKIKWILDQNPTWRDRARRGEILCGTIDTWLIWSLTEEQNHLTDHTNASRTMLYDIRSLQWDENLLQRMDIPAAMLPKAQPSMSNYGHIMLGTNEVAIQGVAGDQQAALFGQLCWQSGMAKNTYGTGCFMLMHVGDQFINSQHGLLTTLCCTDSNKPQYALEGSVFIAGAAIQWLRDGIQLIDASEQTESMADAAIEDEVVFVPAFAGLGAPYWDMSARGAIFGITQGVDRDQLVKATLDALAYQTSDVLAAMEQDANKKLHALRVDGGACANNYLMQFQADILDVQVERPEYIESTALGAAYLAGMHSGLWTSEILHKKRKLDHIFVPNLDDSHRKKKLSRWSDAVQRTRGWAK